MCTTAIAYGRLPGVKLLILSNRDEFFERPAMPAHRWSSNPEIVGGRDLRAGGSWLACARVGRFANVTNVREPHRTIADAPSRGQLVTSFIESDLSGLEFAELLHGEEYNGFNLLVWDGNALTYISNRTDEVLTLEEGVFAMSNAVWGSSWPKVVRARRKLSGLLRASQLNDKDAFDILLDSKRAADSELPSTGVSLEWERVLSSIFIGTPAYGTRCSTLVKMYEDGGMDITELTHEVSRPCASSVLLRIPGTGA